MRGFPQEVSFWDQKEGGKKVWEPSQLHQRVHPMGLQWWEKKGGDLCKTRKFELTHQGYWGEDGFLVLGILSLNPFSGEKTENFN